MGFGLPFLGGFAHAATTSAAQGNQDRLQQALNIYRIRQIMESDKLRQALLLSRLNKPTPKGAGIKMTDKQGKESVWYPATGDVATPPEGSQFATTKAQQSPFTKSWETFLTSQSLTDDTFGKLSPPQKTALYQQYRQSLSPDQALKDQVLELRAKSLMQQMHLNDVELPMVMKLMEKGETTSTPTGSDIVPGASATPASDPTDPFSWGD